MKTDNTRKLAPASRQSEFELFGTETRGRASRNRPNHRAELLNLVEVFNLAGFPASKSGWRNEPESAGKLSERCKRRQMRGLMMENRRCKMLVFTTLKKGPCHLTPSPSPPKDGGEGGSDSPLRQNVRLLFAKFFILFFCEPAAAGSTLDSDDRG
jgi:hypothetical protein